MIKQGVALTGLMEHDWPAMKCRLPNHPRSLPTRWVLQTMTTTTDASEQNNTGPLGGPVTMESDEVVQILNVSASPDFIGTI